MVVVASPSHLIRLRHRLPHGSQTLGVTLPQAAPLVHVAGQLRVPPQLSPIGPPQYSPPLASLQVRRLQVASPLHKPLTGSHTWVGPQLLLHKRLPPQPSPM